MSDAEVQASPGLGPALGFLLIGAAFLVPALVLARRWIPVRAPLDPGWRLVDVLAVVALPLCSMLLLMGLIPGEHVLARLVETEVGLGTGVLWLWLRARRSAGGLASLGLGVPVGGRAYLAGPIVFVPLFVCLAGLGILWTLLGARLGWSGEQEVLRLLRGLSGAELLGASLVTVLAGPFLEELLFRGFLQQALAVRIGARASLVATSLVFALLHGITGLPVLFALSLFLGWLQQRSRCLVLPWSVHALNNAVSLGLAFAQRGG